MLKCPIRWLTLFDALLCGLPIRLNAGSAFSSGPMAVPLWGRVLPLCLGLIILLIRALHASKEKQ